MDKIYTVTEIANLLEVAPSTVRTWIHKDKIFAVRLGNKFAISDRALMDFAFPRFKFARLLCAKNGRFRIMYGLWRMSVQTILAVKSRMQADPDYTKRVAEIKEKIKQIKEQEG